MAFEIPIAHSSILVYRIWKAQTDGAFYSDQEVSKSVTVHMSEGPNVRRFTSPKVHLSEGPLVGWFTSPKVHMFEGSDIPNYALTNIFLHYCV